MDANRERDARKICELEELGWKSMTVWQCELKNTSQLIEKLEIFLRT